MELMREVDGWLSEFRDVFRRRRSFDWFVLCMWAFLLHFDGTGLTSVVRYFGLAAGEYYNVLHFFHSSAFINLVAMSLGLLQMLSLQHTERVWARLPSWFRTLRKEAGPSEQIVRATLQAEVDRILSSNEQGSLLAKNAAPGARPGRGEKEARDV